MASLPGSNFVTLRTRSASRMSSDGPDAKAEARKRGARMAVSQKGRAASPQYRKAVTVWMLTAHGTEREMIGFTQAGGGRPARSARKVAREMTTLRSR